MNNKKYKPIRTVAYKSYINKRLRDCRYRIFIMTLALLYIISRDTYQSIQNCYSVEESRCKNSRTLSECAKS